MALPTIECFRSLDRINQIAAIYEALYVATGSAEELTPPECFLGEDSRDQITDIFSALKLIGSPPGPDPVPVDFYIDFEAGSVDALASVVNLNAATHGSTGTWEVEGSPVDHAYFAATGIGRRIPVICDGVVYSGAGTRKLFFDLDEREAEAMPINVLRNQLPAGHSDLTASGVIVFGADRDPADETDIRLEPVQILCGSETNILQQFIPTGSAVDSPGTVRTHTTGTATHFGWNIPIAKGVPYYWALRCNTTSGFCELVLLHAVTGAFVGASRCPGVGGEATRFVLQDYLTARGGYMSYDGVAMDWTNAAFPGEPFTLPPVTNVTVEQTGIGEITLTWESKAFSVKIERRADGGPWGTIEADLEEDYLRDPTSTYVDDGLSDATDYEYRVTALINEHQSSAVVSDLVTTDDSEFLGVERQFILTTTNGGTTDQGSFIAYNFTTGLYPVTITKFAMFGNAGQYDATQTIEVRLASDDSLVASRTISFQTSEAYIVTDVADIALAPSTQYYLNFPTMNFNTARNFTIGSVNLVGGITFDGIEGFPNAGIGPVNFYYTLSPP